MMIEDIFQKVKNMNLSTIITQGYINGLEENNAMLQPILGMHDEYGFKRLDNVICTAQNYGIKLIIYLVNNWEAFGGMDQYVTWINQKLNMQLKHDDFYINAFAKIIFMNYIYFMISRINTCNGIADKDDPAILAWQLANELWGQSDHTGKSVLAWADDISMASIENEGFLCEECKKWMYDCSQGTNSAEMAKLPNIDYLTVHYINKPIEISKNVKKPHIIEEFGDKNDKIGKYKGQNILMRII